MPAYPEFEPAACSVARTLDVLGDTWSVLVLRELFLGAHRFDQIHDHLGIARNILAARLKRLVEHGLIEKRQYQAHPPRFEYHLTRKGMDLQPVLIGLMQWGDRLWRIPAVARGARAPCVRPPASTGDDVRGLRRVGWSPSDGDTRAQAVRVSRRQWPFAQLTHRQFVSRKQRTRCR